MPRRLSPRTLYVDPVKRLGTFLLPLAAAFLLSGHLTVDRAATYGLIGGGLALTFSLVRWLTFRYAVHPDRLEITSGLVARRVRSIPLDRIRGVDLTASPLHRMLGIVVVRVDAAAGGSDRRDEGVLDAVAADEGDRLRRILLERSRLAEPPPRPQPVGEQPAGYEPVPLAQPRDAPVIARVRPSWFLLSPLTGAYLLAPLALLGTIWGWIGQSETLNERQVEGAARWVAAAPWLVAIVALLFVVVVMPVASVAMAAVLNWNFTVRAARDAFELERGLLTRRHVTLERRRLRGWELVEALPARLVRAARLKALVTGLGTQAQRAELLPVAPAAAARQLATGMVGAQPVPLRTHPRAALRRRLVRAVAPWLVLAVAAWLLDLPAAAIPLAVLAALGVPLGIDRYHALGHGYDGARLVVRRGSWSRRTVVLQRRAVVGWQVRESLFQRRQGLATLTVGVGAGSGGYPAVDMDAEQAATFVEEVTPGWVTPFLLSATRQDARRP